MTMRVRVTNMDPAGAKEGEVHVIHHGQHDPAAERRVAHRHPLPSQASVEVWLSATCSLEVVELPSADRPASPAPDGSAA